MSTADEIRTALTGPFASLRIPFCRDGAIDCAALRKMIDFSIQAGSATLMLTHGDSLYSLLTDEEIADVTRVVVEHADGRAMVIAADNAWWTGKAIDFARYAASIGADMLMLMPPNWGKSCTPQTFAEHYAAIAKEIPVMVVTGDVQVKGGQMRREKGGHLRDKNSALMGACQITFWSSPFVGTGRP